MAARWRWRRWGLFLAVAFRGGLAFELGAGVELGAVDARWRR